MAGINHGSFWVKHGRVWALSYLQFTEYQISEHKIAKCNFAERHFTKYHLHQSIFHRILIRRMLFFLLIAILPKSTTTIVISLNIISPNATLSNVIFRRLVTYYVYFQFHFASIPGCPTLALTPLPLIFPAFVLALSYPRGCCKPPTCGKSGY